MNKDRLKIRLLHYYKKWVDFSKKIKVKKILKTIIVIMQQSLVLWLV